MNPQIRKLIIAILAMVLSLLGAATYIQYFHAPALVADGRNPRPLYESWKRDRGPIIVAGDELARSQRSDDKQLAFQREYPQGRLYSHVTGYAAVRINALAGLEAAAAAELEGTSDSLWKQRIQDLLTGAQPRGGGIDLTLNPQMQAAAAAALGDRTGAVVVLEPATGEIKAMVSSPSFDPNKLVVPDAKAAEAELTALQENPARPLVNRGIQDRFPPGSVFKLVVTAAALEEGLVQPQGTVEAPTELPLPGTSHKITNSDGRDCFGGNPTLTQAFAQSCNPPFAILGTKLGWKKLRDQAVKFGFDESLSVPLKVVPSVVPRTEDDAQLAMASIGQFNDQVTPLQMAMVSAAIANHGKLMQPFIIESTLNRDLEVQSTTQPKVLSEPISAGTAQSLKEMMVAAVQDGTAAPGAIPGVQVAAKTGTAQTGRGGSHGWYTGFAPADNPRYAIAVLLVSNSADEYYYGGPDAGKVAAAVLKAGLK